jgi:hypothetical protein
MHISLRAAGFSVMAMFASCGVGAQAQAQEVGVQTPPGKHSLSDSRLYAPTEAYVDKSWKLDEIKVVE